MKNYKSPTQIKEAFPDLKWNTYQIGYLLYLRLVDGYKTARSSKIKVLDVLALHNQKFGTDFKIGQ